jgi:hypothetical protein
MLRPQALFKKPEDSLSVPDTDTELAREQARQAEDGLPLCVVVLTVNLPHDTGGGIDGAV